jgi:hypothetical protein
MACPTQVESLCVTGHALLMGVKLNLPVPNPLWLTTDYMFGGLSHAAVGKRQ